MIDHISLRARDFAKTLTFYKAALAPLGYEVVMEFPGLAGMGAGGKPDLWITHTDLPINPTHVAFACSRDQVHAFHQAALSAGGVDHGAPGPRPDYHRHYYSAFALDPDGNNVEAVCHTPEHENGVVSEPDTRTPSSKKATRSAARRPSAKPAKKARPAPPPKKTAQAAAKKSGKSAPKKTAKAAGKPARKPAGKSATKSATKKRR
jgi:catechol 2,3-dioxygenase-like lactoylglutathione lyase family enzyme